MPPTITAISNTGDGLKLDVTLSGAPTGALAFRARRRPEDAWGGALAYASLGGNVYRVTVRASLTRIALPYFIKATDDGGDSASFSAFIAYGSTLTPAWQMAKRGKEILEAHAGHLAQAGREFMGGGVWVDGATIADPLVKVGMPGSTTREVSGAGIFPLVALAGSREPEDWVYVPAAKQISLGVSVYAYAFHDAPTVWLGACWAFGGAIKRVLNQAHYFKVTLDNGMVVKRCHAEDAQPVEEWVEHLGRWVTAVTVPWGGETDYAYEGEVEA